MFARFVLDQAQLTREDAPGGRDCLKDSQRKETRALPTAGVASQTFVSHGRDGVRAVRPSKDRPGYPRNTSLQGN